MYEFVRGPMMWVSAIICVVGLTFQLIMLFRMTEKKERVYFSVKKKKKDKKTSDKIKRITTEVLSKLRFFPSKVNRAIILTYPSTSILSFIFHFCIVITPIFLVGHNILIFESWGVSVWSFSEAFSDVLTIILLVCGIVFLIRRIFVTRIRSVSSFWDYILLFITIAPFITGFLSYHQLVDYKSIIIAHMIAGELMLIAMGVTKLSHPVFYFFARFSISNEFSFRAGSRSWY